MDQVIRQKLSHVFWIGGATDSGKSTVARIIAERRQFLVCHYDERDRAHHEQLARTSSYYRDYIEASLDERWVFIEPKALLQRTLLSFRDRFSLMIEDLLAYPNEQTIIAEGFGLLPELLAPVLSSPSQAVWLVPTQEFKQASMIRRGKPSFGLRVSDPATARSNLLARDKLLANYFREQVPGYGYIFYEVDGSIPPDELAITIEQHFFHH
jgi:2-phosphoglycerate kinase